MNGFDLGIGHGPTINLPTCCVRPLTGDLVMVIRLHHRWDQTAQKTLQNAQRYSVTSGRSMMIRIDWVNSPHRFQNVFSNMK